MVKVFYDCIPTKKPTVDIFLPCCGEPHHILERTYKHVAALDYPTYTAYILDEKNDPIIQSLAQK